MKAVQGMRRERHRAQRGSVLSGVLIIVAFLAIISGALVTELSTHFLISRTLVNRVSNEATVNSAMELALDQLQHTPIGNGCPGITNMPRVNGQNAVVSYISCWPTVRESPQFKSVALAAPFKIDGHSIIPSLGQDLYFVGDTGGTIYQYTFGSSAFNWSRSLGTAITGPPLATFDGVNLQDLSDFVPVAGGGGSGSCQFSACVTFLHQDYNPAAPSGFNAPNTQCFMRANAAVTSRPAAGIAVYFGDSAGTLWAYTATESSPCAFQASQATPGNASIVAGPVLVQNGARDEIYVVTSQGSTAQLLWYEYQQSPVLLTPRRSLTLPFPNPVGLMLENAAVAPRIAITFSGGGVAVFNTNATHDPTLAASKALGTTITAAPFWCSCPGGAQVGVGGVNGTFYLLDSNLTIVASYATGSPIRTTPAYDGVGEWFFGADDGYVYELQQPQSGMVRRVRYGPVGGNIRSSVLLGGCPSGICIYFGATNGNAYIVPLSARDATLTSCLSSSPPACSSDHPRLWAQVEVGSAASPQTVHVQGWSYYSP